MKYNFFLIGFLLLYSCGNEKVLQLPEINKSEITDIKDVSHAYLFYDETKADTVELNRKNLISTTNWLINVDKRLTLKQAIPHIKFLQEKKANSSHKNEKAKNYFTCHDTSRNDLGFVEFTDVIFHSDFYDLYERKGIKNSTLNHEALLQFINLDSIKIHFPEHSNFNYTDEIVSNERNLLNDLRKIKDTTDVTLYLSFLKKSKFQDYITIRKIIKDKQIKGIEISNHEFIIDSM